MKILFPTDFSTNATNALSYAAQLAQVLDATIDLIHVYHLPFTEASNMPYQKISEMLDTKKEEVLKKLDHLRDNLVLKNLIGQRIPVYGIFVDHEISDLANHGEYDLIIMGTKGEAARFEKLIGSVTTRTMMNAPCPVMAIPQDVSYKQIHQIAYATNFAISEEIATKQLNDLALLLGAKLHYVHIEKRKNVLGPNTEIRLDYYPTPFTDFTLIKNDSVLAGLDQYIKDKRIDLLSLFIPERRLWERLFHSSFARKMTFNTKIPLLVFRE